MENVEVVDNFLSEYHFDLLHSYFMGEDMAWFYRDGIVNDSDGGFQFTAGIFVEGKKFDLFSFIEPCLSKLGCNTVHRIKANLRPRTLIHRKSQYHIDLTGAPPNLKTAIYYINTCNGYTKFKKGGKVKSVANRMVIFNHNMEHTGVSCTDKKRRVVINFNYE